MAISNPYWREPQATDFASRLRRPEMRGPAYGEADRGMVVQPYADPGNALPNIDKPNLVQPEQQGMVQQDIWRVGGQNALMQPLLQLLMRRPDLMQQFLRQNQLMMQP